MPKPLNACTIVSKNYLPFARVLAKSFRRHQPGGRFFVLLVDRVDGAFDPAAEPFELLEAEDLPNLPRALPFLFKYTLLEANTAIKPFFLEHLIDAHGLDNLTYFDPDIWILDSLDALAAHVEQHSIVLTPHLDVPIDDGAYPGEQAILQSGAYNLGFVALRATEVSRRLLRWWQNRLYDDCLVRIPEGLFVDQKWMDLTPGLFRDVLILEDPGYNVAYWNLHGRRVSIVDESEAPPRARVERRDPQVVTDSSHAASTASPLVFFHFSGIQPESLDGVSKHQNRFVLTDLGGAAHLYRRYAARLFEEGWAECSSWPYAFARFSNNVAIPAAARSLFHDLAPAERERFGNPFDARGTDSFFAWATAPVRRGGLPRIFRHLATAREDLRAAFPDADGADRPGFLDWLHHVGPVELKLDARLLALLPRDAGPEPIQVRVKNRLRRIAASDAGKRVKGRVTTLLGPERTAAVKRRLRRGAPAPPPAPSTPGRGLLDPIDRPGINLVGYLSAETGMGQAARGLARSLEAAGIPHTLHDLELNVVARRGESRFAGLRSDFRYGIDLWVVNADQVASVREHLGAAPGFAGRRVTVGLWLWEQETFPDAWRSAFEPFDEIWTPSSFCVDAIGAVSPVPVRRVPLPVPSFEERSRDRPGSEETAAVRDRFDLGPDDFVVLYLFNYLSYAERKNPRGAVEAFRQAFGDDPTKRLVLKTSQADFAASDHAALLEAVGDAPNIQVIDEYLDRATIDALTATADAYLSLHRAEGFGLTLAEAMAAGTPVVSTTYSGPRDFFGVSNGLPVRYALHTLDEAVGPYPAGSRWAAPDPEHAAEHLQRLASDAAFAKHLADTAQASIQTELSTQAVGNVLQKRFDEILRRAKSLQPPIRPSVEI